MSKNEIIYSLEQLENASNRLKEAVAETDENDSLKQDGVIQRFEFTFELLWKTLKLYLSHVGKPVNNPRDTLKTAFKEQIFSDEATLLTMLDDRNLCTHVYDFKTTRKIFGHIREKYLQAILSIIGEIQVRISQL